MIESTNKYLTVEDYKYSLSITSKDELKESLFIALDEAFDNLTGSQESMMNVIESLQLAINSKTKKLDFIISEFCYNYGLYRGAIPYIIIKRNLNKKISLLNKLNKTNKLRISVFVNSINFNNLILDGYSMYFKLLMKECVEPNQSPFKNKLFSKNILGTEDFNIKNIFNQNELYLKQNLYIPDINDLKFEDYIILRRDFNNFNTKVNKLFLSKYQFEYFIQEFIFKTKKQDLTLNLNSINIINIDELELLEIKNWLVHTKELFKKINSQKTEKINKIIYLLK